jgi:hypothetical protein
MRHRYRVPSNLLFELEPEFNKPEGNNNIIDLITRERRAGRTLHGLAEAPVEFGPTYKFDVLDRVR